MQSLVRPVEVSILERDRMLVVRVYAGITIRNAAAIHTAVLSAWQASGYLEAVILDLGHVQHMDSTGVGLLLELANRAKKAGISLRLCCLQESPRRFLDRIGLSCLFEICTTIEKAMLVLPA